MGGETEETQCLRGLGQCPGNAFSGCLWKRKEHAL